MSDKIKGVNLFEVNGIEYSDNIPDNFEIVVTKEQYCDYLQLKEENQQLKDNWNKLKKWLEEYKENSYGLGSYETGISDGLGDVLKKMQELEGNK